MRLITACRYLAAFAALLAFAHADRCFADNIVGLGAASDFTVLGLDTSSQGTAINASLVTINGTVGVSDLSTLVNMAPSVINGTVFYQTAGSVTGPGHFNGVPPTEQQSLTQAVTDALNASAQNALLTPNTTVTGNVTTAHTFTAAAGTGIDTVIDITGSINLNNANITLSGNSSDRFLVNVGGSLSLTGTASLALTGGVTASNVIYNFTGDGSGGSFNTHVGDAVNGTLLAPGYSMTLDGTFNGALIGGPTGISLMSGVVVNGHPFVPEPSEFVALAAMSLVFGGGICLSRRRAKPASA